MTRSPTPDWTRRSPKSSWSETTTLSRRTSAYVYTQWAVTPGTGRPGPPRRLAPHLEAPDPGVREGACEDSWVWCHRALTVDRTIEVASHPNRPGADGGQPGCPGRLGRSRQHLSERSAGRPRRGRAVRMCGASRSSSSRRPADLLGVRHRPCRRGSPAIDFKRCRNSESVVAFHTPLSSPVVPARCDGRMSATAIRPTSRPSITTGTDWPSVKTSVDAYPRGPGPVKTSTWRPFPSTIQ
jgi:hypothetical protein